MAKLVMSPEAKADLNETLYHCTDDTVYIDRILYGRRDYMVILFGDKLESDDETDA